MSEGKIVRLTSGEEIISKVVENEDSITLKNPAILIPAGREQLALGQWLPYADYDKKKWQNYYNMKDESDMVWLDEEEHDYNNNNNVTTKIYYKDNKDYNPKRSSNR